MLKKRRKKNKTKKQGQKIIIYIYINIYIWSLLKKKKIGSFFCKVIGYKSENSMNNRGLKIKKIKKKKEWS